MNFYEAGIYFVQLKGRERINWTEHLFVLETFTLLVGICRVHHLLFWFTKKLSIHWARQTKKFLKVIGKTRRKTKKKKEELQQKYQPRVFQVVSMFLFVLTWITSWKEEKKKNKQNNPISSHTTRKEFFFFNNCENWCEFLLMEFSLFLWFTCDQ